MENLKKYQKLFIAYFINLLLINSSNKKINL